MLPVLSLIVIISISVLITRVATIMLTHTGISTQLARFQARSALTGVGYTTREAEKIINHPVRRKIINTLMLIGNAGIASVTASLLLTFVGENDIPGGYKLLILLAGITLLWLLTKSPIVNRMITSITNRILKKYTSLSVVDYEELLGLKGDYRIFTKIIQQDDWVVNQQLKDLQLNEEGLNVLGIHRRNGKYIGVPNGKSLLQEGDEITVYGRKGVVETLNRKSGYEGDVQHKKNMDEQREISEKENDK